MLHLLLQEQAQRSAAEQGAERLDHEKWVAIWQAGFALSEQVSLQTKIKHALCLLG